MDYDVGPSPEPGAAGNIRDAETSGFLVCGFQPLHLATFLQGYFAARFPDEAAEIRTGLYGDLERTLLTAADSEAEAAAVVIEWEDLDPRLGLRSAGNWALSAQADIIAGCQKTIRLGVEGIEFTHGEGWLVSCTTPTRRDCAPFRIVLLKRSNWDSCGVENISAGPF
jgi:hypothetical protein